MWVQSPNCLHCRSTYGLRPWVRAHTTSTWQSYHQRPWPQSTCVVKHGQETMFGHTKTGGNKSGAVNYEKTSLDEICSMLGVEHKQVAQVPAHLGVKHRTWQGHRFSTWCLHNPKWPVNSFQRAYGEVTVKSKAYICCISAGNRNKSWGPLHHLVITHWDRRQCKGFKAMENPQELEMDAQATEQMCSSAWKQEKIEIVCLSCSTTS